MSDPRELPVPASWRTEIDGWRVSLRAAGYPETTMYTRRAHVAAAARALDGSPREVTPDDLLGYLAGRVWARETRRSVHASLRAFFRWLGRDDLGAVLPAVKPAEPSPRPTPEDVYAAALSAADTRTYVILRLAAEAGLRRGEICQVNARDLGDDLIGPSLRVHGKGGRDRDVPISNELAGLVRRTCAGGWLLPGNIGGHLAPATVGRIASAAMPGIWTAHTLRHRYATRVHDATSDLVAVQRLLGHASVATTQRYVATDAARLRRAALAAA